MPPASLNVAVLGLDSRGTEGVVARTDSISLVNISPSNLRMSQLSIPRDIFIQVPSYGLRRINSINVLGELEDNQSGPELFKRSIAQSFDIEVDRYIRIDFQTFVALIDAVGGVEIYVERALTDYNYPTPDGGIEILHFDSGLQLMDGERALKYARTRKADDDYRRAERQQQVVSALFSKLLNPTTWGSVLQVFQANVETDLTVFDVIQMAPAIVLSRGHIDQFVIDREYITGSVDGYAIPDYAKIQPWFEGRFDE